jgi:hypothetical protein
VTVTAANAGGSSAPATSSPTAVVTAGSGTFGKATVGGTVDGGIFNNYKIVNSASLSSAGAVTKLSVYAVPGFNSSGSEQLEAVIYANAGGVPGALLATGTQVSYQASVNGTGWLDLPFASAVKLSPGAYWLGFITGGTSEAIGYRYDTVAKSRAYDANAYSTGPTNPFGSATLDSEQASLYATYTTS